ncbi:MAG: hypothetical protein HY319_20150 [Armatimonadetes bacterium]|nr:hypothetical protein [Armatimonadota bacterium]
MLAELTRETWMSMLALEPEEVPRALLLRGTRNLRTYYEQYARHLEKPRELRLPNGLLEDVCLGRLDGVPVAYASVYGAPMAAEVVHVAGVLGVPLVVHTGCYGALAGDIEIGDLLAVTDAGVGEGVSHYYHASARRFRARMYGRDLQPMGGRLRFGPLFTTCALLAESREQLTRWADEGYLGVDMETSAVFAVAEHFGMDRISLLYAADLPLRDHHLLLHKPEAEALRAQGNRTMIELALRIVRDYCVVRD